MSKHKFAIRILSGGIAAIQFQKSMVACEAPDKETGLPCTHCQEAITALDDSIKQITASKLALEHDFA